MVDVVELDDASAACNANSLRGLDRPLEVQSATRVGDVNALGPGRVEDIDGGIDRTRRHVDGRQTTCFGDFHADRQNEDRIVRIVRADADAGFIAALGQAG